MAANTKKNQEVTEEIKEKATTKVDDSKVEKNEVSTVENTETQVAEPKKGIVGTVVGVGTAVKNGVTGFAKKHPFITGLVVGGAAGAIGIAAVKKSQSKNTCDEPADIDADFEEIPDFDSEMDFDVEQTDLATEFEATVDEAVDAQ